jgi:WD40 repeat protein
MTTIRPALSAAACLLACTTRAPLAAPTIKEQEVAPPWKPGTVLTLSQRGMRFASTRVKDDGKWLVQIDGVESPAYDEVLKSAVTVELTFTLTGDVGVSALREQGPVAFGPDGKRYAYAARNGEDVVVILDGTQIFRGRSSPSAPPVQQLRFTPDGKHVYFFSASGDTLSSVVLMMDGKPASPPLDAISPLLFSADGSHWVLSAGAAKAPATKLVVIDGKAADYACEAARISPDGRHVACFTRAETLPAGHSRGVLVDGKLTVSGPKVDLLKLSPAGDVFVRLLDVRNNSTLYRNGTLVEGSQGVTEVMWSPDGSHWAAKGISNQGAVHWVMYDGKKQKDYTQVSDVFFAADSTAWAYLAQSAKGSHAVINGEEREPSPFVRGPMFARTGHNVIYAAGPNTIQIYFNGAVSMPLPSIFGLELSPDGTRLGYYAGISGLSTQPVIDGEPKGFIGSYNAAQRIVFSPDSKHVVATVMHPTLKSPTIYVDGTFLPLAEYQLSPREFTPDNQHLIFTSPGPVYEKVVQTARTYVDGDVVATCTARGVTWANSPKMVRVAVGVMQWAGSAGSAKSAVDPEAYEVEPDGSIVILCNTPGPGGYGPIKKITVTPAAGSSFATWVASLPK